MNINKKFIENYVKEVNEYVDNEFIVELVNIMHEYKMLGNFSSWHGGLLFESDMETYGSLVKQGNVINVEFNTTTSNGAYISINYWCEPKGKHRDEALYLGIEQKKTFNKIKQCPVFIASHSLDTCEIKSEDYQHVIDVIHAIASVPGNTRKAEKAIVALLEKKRNNSYYY